MGYWGGPGMGLGASRRRVTYAMRTLVMVFAFAAISVSSAAAKGGKIDFGDAPDGARAGYLSKPGVVGRFPSKLASGGPRHEGLGVLRLGPTSDGEADSMQVDRDRDDGAVLAAPRACGTARLTVAMRGSPALPTTGRTVYVNAWFDWNRDGDWADESDGCAPEWAVRNMPVPASSIGKATMLPITFKAGKQVRELWYRVTATLDQVQIDPTGRGRSVPYRYGETEDYLHQLPGGIWLGEGEEEERKKRKEEEERRKEKFKVRCAPPVQVIAHGQTAAVRFKFVDKGKGFIWSKLLNPRNAKGYSIRLVPTKNQRGVPPGFKRGYAFRVKSRKIDPPTRMETVTVRARFKRGRVVHRAACKVVIVHVGKERHKKKKGKKKILPPKIKPVRCEGGCAGEVPPRPPGKGTTITDYTVEPGDHVRLRIDPTDPLHGVTIPLLPPNPTPRDPPKVSGAGDQVKCEMKTLQLTGGPAAVVCKLDPPAPPAVDSFFDIFYDVPVSATEPISGTLDDANGTPVEGFTAGPRVGGLTAGPPAPTPVVSGSGTLSPSPANANSVDFKVHLDVQNTTLDHFLIVVPPSLEIENGGAAGFICDPVKYAGFEDRGLDCHGFEVGTTLDAMGGFKLKSPRPGQLAAGTELLGSGGGTTYGPFVLAQTPDPTGGGTLTGTGDNSTRDFTLELGSFGALDEFTLDFPTGVQVSGGNASNGMAFSCEKVMTDEAENGLKCSGQPITNGQPINGTVEFSAPQPTLGSGTQLTAKGPATAQIGPFAVGSGP